MEGKKLLLACGAITLSAFVIVGAVFFAMSRSSAPSQTRPSPITASGTLACLPHKNVTPGQPQTLECAIGLHTGDGRYYSLQELGSENSMTPFTKRVEIEGDLYPPAADDRYDTVGTIKIKKFTAN